MSRHVLGLDLGLATAGAASITPDGCIRTWSKTSPAPPSDHTISDVADRIAHMARWARELVTAGTVLAVVEGPAHAAQHGQAHERAAVWWMTVRALCRVEVPVAVLAPATAKAYIAGHGRADKAAVAAAVAAAWPRRGLDRVTEHEADAVALATAGVDWLGWPGPWLQGRRGAKALLRARWPERDSIPV